MKISESIKNRVLFILYFQQIGTNSSMGVENHRKVETDQNPRIWKFTKSAEIYIISVKKLKGLYYQFVVSLESQNYEIPNVEV